MNDNYKVGLYIRLSKEDDDKKEVSESIQNQKDLLLQYVKENNYYLVDIYIDDGYSGTNFDRPAYKKMIEDIENKKINMVITKDMSRLGRDYIGTGNLIEKYFPEHGVRYIAVTDNIDTYLDNMNNDIAPFKAIMNDMYAKDISKKIRSSLRAKQKEGKWVGGRTPFGYEIDPSDKNHLIINQEQAFIVRRIFDMSLNGDTYYKIAKVLTQEGVKTPSQYYPFEWKKNYSIRYGLWNSKTVQDILTNQMYIGDMIQNKRRKVNYKIKKIVRNKNKDYVVVENTHDAIISKEIFYEVQKRLPKNKGRLDKKEFHLLDGLLYCGDCGHRISITSRRKKDNNCYTICNYYRTNKKMCQTHSNNYDELEKIILTYIQNICRKLKDDRKIIEEVKNILEKNSYDDSEENSIMKKIDHYTFCLDEIYLDYLNKKIKENQYLRIKNKMELELEALEQSLKNKKNAKKKNISLSRNMMKDILSMKRIDRRLLLNLLEKVEIYQDKKIIITLSF